MIPELVRVAGPEHAPAIAEIERRAAHAPWSLSSIEETLRRPTNRGFVVGAPAAGHLLASCVAEEGEILTVAVLPEHRRKGYARALMAACEAWWRERDVVAGWLEVRSDNAAAQALYLARGWVVAHVRPAYYGDGCDALMMRWSP